MCAVVCRSLATTTADRVLPTPYGVDDVQALPEWLRTECLPAAHVPWGVGRRISRTSSM